MHALLEDGIDVNLEGGGMTPFIWGFEEEVDSAVGLDREGIAFATDRGIG